MTADRWRGPELGHARTGRTTAVVRGALWSMLSAFAPAAVGALVFALASRVLGPAEFGLVALAGSIATVGSALAPAGFGDGLVQRKDIDGRHLDVVFWLCLGCGCLIYAVLAAIGAPLGAYLGQPQLLTLLLVLGIRVVVEMIAVVPDALLVRSMSFKQMAVRTTIASAASGVVCITLLGLGFGLWALALSIVAASIASCIGSVLAARWAPRFRFNLGALRQLAGFGLFTSANRAIGMLSPDQVLIGLLLGPAPLGIFGFARRIFQLLSDLIAGALGTVSFSLLSSLQSEQAKLKRAFLFATFASSAVSFPLFVGLAAVAGDVIPLAFGAHWAVAVPAVQGFCFLGLITSVGLLQASLIKGLGHAGLWFWYMLAKQLMTAFYVVLFHTWGVTSLVYAIVILNYLLWIPAVYMVARLIGTSMFRYLLHFVAPGVATLAMLGAVQWMGATLGEPETIPMLVAKISVGAVVYALVLALVARNQVLHLVKTVMQRSRPSPKASPSR